jgi:hypothetical protein
MSKSVNRKKERLDRRKAVTSIRTPALHCGGVYERNSDEFLRSEESMEYRRR